MLVIRGAMGRTSSDLPRWIRPLGKSLAKVRLMFRQPRYSFRRSEADLQAPAFRLDPCSATWRSFKISPHGHASISGDAHIWTCSPSTHDGVSAVASEEFPLIPWEGAVAEEVKLIHTGVPSMRVAIEGMQGTTFLSRSIPASGCLKDDVNIVITKRLSQALCYIMFNKSVLLFPRIPVLPLCHTFHPTSFILHPYYIS